MDNQIDVLEEQRAKVKMLEDVFIDFLLVHENGHRFDLYDLIIDCRRNLYEISFEECREAVDNLVSSKVLKSGHVKNQYILIKGAQ
jgi:hypothetical protein